MTNTQITAEIFHSTLLQHFGMSPTDDQIRLFHGFQRLIFSSRPRATLIVNGHAGTGKTTSLKALLSCLDQHAMRYELMAPTGRAAKVMELITGRSASTIHRRIYFGFDETREGFYSVRPNKTSGYLYIVDEASMIGDNSESDVLSHLMEFVFENNANKLILMGDSAQLPPVAMAESPALSEDELRRNYDLTIATIHLQQVVRQEMESGILLNANRLRRLQEDLNKSLPVMQVNTGGDVVCVDSLSEHLESAYSTFGIADVIIITRSNKRANLFNQQIRQRVLGCEEEIQSGDRMMVIRNNYFWMQHEPTAGFIANGDIIRISRVLGFEQKGKFRFCRAEIELCDDAVQRKLECVLLCNTINLEQAGLDREQYAELTHEISKDYPDISHPKLLKKALKEDVFMNALHVKFAFAITCHKAQGGQWPCVFVDQGYLTEEMTGKELFRWYYTAVTRASEQLYLIGLQPCQIEEKQIELN
jgi:exodeoxyribonuclease-5